MFKFSKIVFDQKNRVFSARAPPFKLVYIGAKGAFRKILGSVIKKGYQNSTKGGTLWVGRGSNTWGGGGGRPP